MRVALHLAGVALMLAVIPVPDFGGFPPKAAQAADLPEIQANDNRVAAGELADGVLNLSIRTGTGTWRFDGDGKPGVPMQAFAEGDGPLQIPGPAIRVPAGTEIRLSLHNTDGDGSLTLHGLYDRPAAEDSLVELAPGETRDVSFRLSTPGTYYYWGAREAESLGKRMGADSQLAGAIIVDPVGVEPDPKEEIFVITEWLDAYRANGKPVFSAALAVINGRSWPATERLTYTEGEAVKWRWINASMENHPLHLHGFYFQVDSRGDGLSDVIYPDGPERDWAVTEKLMVGDTISTTWIPTQPGNWVFHCHNPYHMRQHFPLDLLQTKDFPARDSDAYYEALAATREMAGMVIGVTVKPKDPNYSPQTPDGRRKIEMVVEETPESTEKVPAYRYVVDGDRRPEVLEPAVGPLLVLTRDEPTEVTIHNRIPEMTTVHWHGIELEAYYDGMGDFGGDPVRGRSPMLHEGETFVAKFTPPRAGTFMYHTHMIEAEQIEAGLAGPLVVLEPGESFDPSRDHIVLATSARSFTELGKVMPINGVHPPEPIEVVVGQKHRFRLINLHSFETNLTAELKNREETVEWRAIAKDGRDLPAERQVMMPARQLVTIGETHDFEFVADAPGDYRLELTNPAWGKTWTTIPVKVVEKPTKRAGLVAPTGRFEKTATSLASLLSGLLSFWSGEAQAATPATSRFPTDAELFAAACLAPRTAAR